MHEGNSSVHYTERYYLKLSTWGQQKATSPAVSLFGIQIPPIVRTAEKIIRGENQWSKIAKEIGNRK